TSTRLLLAEVAARLGVPLDIHMEAVPGPEPFVVPPRLQGGNTPPTVPPNIPQLRPSCATTVRRTTSSGTISVSTTPTFGLPS
ncbi:MAG: hypothetical protein AB1758_26600, partial [Candidatus Eremiobacterota bacterium]